MWSLNHEMVDTLVLGNRTRSREKQYQNRAPLYALLQLEQLMKWWMRWIKWEGPDLHRIKYSCIMIERRKYRRLWPI